METFISEDKPTTHIRAENAMMEKRKTFLYIMCKRNISSSTTNMNPHKHNPSEHRI